MSRRKPDRAYIYDYVKIIEPKFFIRCGYPLTTKMVYNEMFENNKENKEVIEKMLGHFGLGQSIKDGVPFIFSEDKGLHGLAVEISYKIAREMLGVKKWGGKERSIYTIILEQFRGKTFLVEGTKMCWTGTREPASGGYDYYNGGEEYDPPYLGNAKAHRILRLSSAMAHTDATVWELRDSRECVDDLMIEDCFVEKVKVNKDGILVES